MRKLWAEKYQELVDKETEEKEAEFLKDVAGGLSEEEKEKRLEEIRDAVVSKYEKLIEEEEESVKKRILSEQRVTLHKCSRCKVVAYCGRSCQSADWPRHKTFCKN